MHVSPGVLKFYYSGDIRGQIQAPAKTVAVMKALTSLVVLITTLIIINGLKAS